MNHISKEELEKYFTPQDAVKTVRCNMYFGFQEVQEFLNRHGYEIFIKEQRATKNNYNSSGDVNGTFSTIYTRLVCAPIGTELPEILPEPPQDYLFTDDCWYYNLQKTFEKVMKTQMLKL